MSPRVTIGMPVFNDIKFIEKAILSLLNQSFKDFELVIFDDNSSDGSAEICISFQKIDPRVRYYRNNKNVGISRNMQGLLRMSDAEYFMWAANDDFWDRDFLKTLVNELDGDLDLVSVFCSYSQVDEKGEVIRDGIIEDFEGKTAYERISKMILSPSDGFGYGLFRRDLIRSVEFPVWWWPNKSCPYNNIYPTLFYYLAKGKYKILRDKILWFNLIKSNENINHKIPFSNSFIPCYLAFLLRKLNLVYKCFLSIYKVKNTRIISFVILPRLIFSWFFITVFYNIHGKYKDFRKGHIETFI